jgi:hypothetical protein
LEEIQVEQEKKLNQLGPITLFALRANILALVILLAFTIFKFKIILVIFSLPYACNIVVFKAQQKLTFIKFTKNLNYTFMVIWLGLVLFLITDRDFGNIWLFPVMAGFMLIFGSALTWLSARQIKSIYLNDNK